MTPSDLSSIGLTISLQDVPTLPATPIGSSIIGAESRYSPQPESKKTLTAKAARNVAPTNQRPKRFQLLCLRLNAPPQLTDLGTPTPSPDLRSPVSATYLPTVFEKRAA